MVNVFIVSSIATTLQAIHLWKRSSLPKIILAEYDSGMDPASTIVTPMSLPEIDWGAGGIETVLGWVLPVMYRASHGRWLVRSPMCRVGRRAIRF